MNEVNGTKKVDVMSLRVERDSTGKKRGEVKKRKEIARLEHARMAL